MSFFFLDLSQYRPVYAPKDFLEVLLCIRSPNYCSIEWVYLTYKGLYQCWIQVVWDHVTYTLSESLF
jgi:hypothetical protein